MKKSIYYNFPISLLRHREAFSGTKMDYKKNLYQISEYCSGELYSLGWNSKDVEEELNIKISQKKQIYASNSIQTFKMFNDKTIPVTGIQYDLYWQFRNSQKEDFDFQCLWAFLAIKSIVGKKPYQKITNKLLIARMAGFASYKKLEEYFNGRPFPKHILNPDDHYKTRYALDKIKRELTKHFNVNFYGIGSRGFYATTKLTLEKLIFEVEKNRQKHVLAAERQTAREIRIKVLEQLKHEKQLSSTLQEAGINAASS